jgi:protein gp37
MGETSSIRWTAATWNPITGCSKVSPGCANCYAETLSLRRGWSLVPWTPANAERNVVLHPERLSLPLRWRDGRRIFVNSMSDLFHELAPIDYIARTFAIMALANRHTFQVLTKRPDRMQEVVSADAFRDAVERHIIEATDAPRVPYIERAQVVRPSVGATWPLPNVWLGTSIELDRWVTRASFLRATPAAVRFISAEPLLGPLPSLDLGGIDWLIVGGESGAGFRPMEHDWARDLRDRAHDAGTAFYFKQSAGLYTERGVELDGRRYEEYPA